MGTILELCKIKDKMTIGRIFSYFEIAIKTQLGHGITKKPEGMSDEDYQMACRYVDFLGFQLRGCQLEIEICPTVKELIGNP